ncbi:MAG: 50S ribosomal protein L23 [Phycisphaerales bacterium]|nr:MAG: 50S ribosomal protein L23 [Phycisphaerales bacterium]
MHPSTIIKKPIITERSTAAMADENRYTFLVDRRATKTDIKHAVERLYGVRVERVTTQVRKNRERRMRYGYVQPAPTKKAIVRLAEGQTIDLF